MILGMGAKIRCRGGFVALFLLLCLCVSSSYARYSGCVEFATSFGGSGSGLPNCFGSLQALNGCGGENDGKCKLSGYLSGQCLCSTYEPSSVCPSTTSVYVSSYPHSGTYIAVGLTGFGAGASNCSAYPGSCYYSMICDTQAEADSVAASLGSNACTEYKDDCESRGGVWEGSVVDDTTCTSTCNTCNTPVAKAIEKYIYTECCNAGLTPQYKCGFVGLPIGGGMIETDFVQKTCNSASWETNKICNDYFSSASAQSSSSNVTNSSSSNGENYSSSVSEYCKLYPNDWTCRCAANPSLPECEFFNSSNSVNSSNSQNSSNSENSSNSQNSSNSENSSNSQNSSGSGSGGSGGSGAGVNDWEYDYTDSLHRIINTTSRTAINTDSIRENTSAIKTILQQAKCLFTDCTDYELMGEKVASSIDSAIAGLDSNIVIPDGDTAGVLDSMRRMTNFDSLTAFLTGSTEMLAAYEDSIPGALEGLEDISNTAFDSIGETMEGFKDIAEQSFPTSQWGYSGGCPAALSGEITYDLPLVGTVSTGKSLGTYICSPVPGIGANLGTLARNCVRLIVTITMAFGIFTAATGFKGD